MSNLDLKRIEIEVEYQLIMGKSVKRKRPFSVFYVKKIAKRGQIIYRINEPAGVFVILKINKLRKKFIVEEMPCSPIYWETDDNGRRKGPDEECKKKCKIYNKCPTFSPGFAIKEIINGV